MLIDEISLEAKLRQRGSYALCICRGRASSEGLGLLADIQRLSTRVQMMAYHASPDQLFHFVIHSRITVPL